MPNKAIQTVSKEYFDYNKAREKAEKARQQELQRQQQQNNQNSNNGQGNNAMRNNRGNFNSEDDSDPGALYDIIDDDSAEDLQDVMEALEEGDIY